MGEEFDASLSKENVMCTLPKIPGVSVEVFKQDRRLAPEEDGYVGELFSGHAALVAVVDPKASPTFGFLRKGDDTYTKTWDWLVPAEQIPVPRVQEQQRTRQALLVGRSFDADTQIYGTRIELRTFKHGNRAFNVVNYPDNTIGLIQYVRDPSGLTGRVHVWEAALVSQYGHFFVTVHQHYNIPACRSLADGRICFPRLRSGHRQLESLIIKNSPGVLPLISAKDVVPQESTQIEGLGRSEGVVDRWYAPRNMGSIFTNKGKARVHFSDVPARPRLRYLVEGERVKFAELRVPPLNPETEWRKVRKTQFGLQVYGIEFPERAAMTG